MSETEQPKEEEPKTVKRDQEDYVNLTRSEAQNHYRTETTKEEVKKPKEQVAGSKYTDYFMSKIWSWFRHYIRSRFGPKHPFQNYKNEKDDNGIYRLEKSAPDREHAVTISLVADWATDTNESDRIGVLLEKHSTDYSIHLGDVYFVGMKEEIKNNFINENCSWYRGTSGSFAIPGNHEMYSRGISYFRDLLPTLGRYSKERGKYEGQKASYFCLENDHWRIIGLDTGYNSVGIPLLEYIFKPKCGLHDDLMNWLEQTLNLKKDKRGLVLLTHHQYSSAFEEEYKKAAEQLATIIGGNRKVLWLWGHEHRLAVYGKFKRDYGIPAYGRCIGHGGMPVEFKAKLKPDKAKETNLIFHDDRKNKEIKEIEIGYNGFAVMKINDDKLDIEYYDIRDDLLFRESWEADNQTGEIKGLEAVIHSNEMAVIDPDLKKAVE